MPLFDVGDRPTLRATFRDTNGDLADPSAITFKLRDPVGTVITADQDDAVNTSTGVWEWTIPTPFDSAGKWAFRAAGTAGVVTADEEVVHVQKSNF